MQYLQGQALNNINKILKETNKIRVLVKTIDLVEESVFKLSLNSSNLLKKFHIYDIDNPEKHSIIESNDLFFSFTKSGLRLNKKKIISSYLLIQSKNLIEFEGNLYSSLMSIFFDREKNKIHLIAYVDLEEYVESVIALETFHNWSFESHKVSAIMIRTYAKYQMNASKKKIFDILSSNKHQTYKGKKIKITSNMKKALEETKNLFITFRGEPIIAMYDICCGGTSVFELKRVDFNKFPYLEKKTQCNYCKNYKKYSWNINFSKKIAIELLSNFLKNKKINIFIEDIKSVRVVEQTKSKIALKVEFKIIYKLDKKKSFERKEKNIFLNNKDMQILFFISQAKYSQNFRLKYNSNLEQIEIQGKGHGHLFGVCQWGMKILSEMGKKYQEIISYYYPGTEIKLIL